jgi:hypothetical protein
MEDLLGGSPGAHTQIVVLNISGHDVQTDLIRFADHVDDFIRPLAAERETQQCDRAARSRSPTLRVIRRRRRDAGADGRPRLRQDRGGGALPRSACRLTARIDAAPPLQCPNEPDGAISRGRAPVAAAHRSDRTNPTAAARAVHRLSRACDTERAQPPPHAPCIGSATRR